MLSRRSILYFQFNFLCVDVLVLPCIKMFYQVLSILLVNNGKQDPHPFCLSFDAAGRRNWYIGDDDAKRRYQCVLDGVSL